MINSIIKLLIKNNIENYRINETVTESVELFFIAKQLDMRRTKDIKNTGVTLFHDFYDNGILMRGSSAAFIYPSMTDEEIEKALTDAYRAAGFVKNKFFKLPKPEKGKAEAKGSLSKLSLTEAAEKMTCALFAADTGTESFLNSAELFITKSAVHIVSSCGTDVSYTQNRVEGEFIVQCKAGQDVEMSHRFSFDGLESAALENQVREALKIAKDRAAAADAPESGEYDLILSGSSLHTVMNYYISRASAPMIYAKYSTFSPGNPLQGEFVTGDKLNITAVAQTPYSEEGISMCDRVLIKDGVLNFIHGGSRHCSYLGVESTGAYESMRLDISENALSLEEMKNRPCIWAVSFSDFQCDDFSGYFGGEIRLAYLFDGKGGVKLLTGGSVNGSIIEAQKNIRFSKEKYTEQGYEGPFAALFRAVKVAGR